MAAWIFNKKKNRFSRQTLSTFRKLKYLFSIEVISFASLFSNAYRPMLWTIEKLKKKPQQQPSTLAKTKRWWNVKQKKNYKNNWNNKNKTWIKLTLKSYHQSLAARGGNGINYNESHRQHQRRTNTHTHLPTLLGRFRRARPRVRIKEKESKWSGTFVLFENKREHILNSPSTWICKQFSSETFESRAGSTQHCADYILASWLCSRCQSLPRYRVRLMKVYIVQFSYKCA